MPTPDAVWVAWSRRLSQLVEPALQQLLIGAQFRELIGIRRRQARQQRHRCGKPADRRQGGYCPVFGHCSPKP
jgi:hypothetical protein